MSCAILFDNNGAGPRDQEGCRLPDGHAGAHEFLADDGKVIQWETDWECTCSHCRTGDGDYCAVYWIATQHHKEPE